MLPTGQGVSAGGRPGEGRPHIRYRGAHAGEEKQQRVGVQEWRDGSKYEGEFVDGLKHGKGKYTWPNGECYEGSFYKDYKHGDAVHCWPTGHRFIGKIYLNRKEGYAVQLFPDGTTFQGLYRMDQRFGPGVVSYPDGCQDVGLWHTESLLRLCTSIEGGFSLNSLPEYTDYMDPAVTRDPLTQAPILSSVFPMQAILQSLEKSDPLKSLLGDLPIDESCVLPLGIESYCANADYLPLPPGRRRELDQLFHGDLWEADSYQYQGYARDPLSSLPLLPRMRAHIHIHRLHAASVDWDVASVLSLNRDSFGPKGPLEVSSERLIQRASLGDRQGVSRSFRIDLVHPDLADARGHTALIAATVNCHNDVIHLLLNMGADIDKLNCEGMSALAVCFVLYYPFQSLHTTEAEKICLELLPKPQARQSQSTSGNSPETHSMDLNPDTTSTNRPQSSNTGLGNRTNETPFSDQTAEELTEQIPGHGSSMSDDSDHGFFSDLHNDVLDGPETTADTEHGEEGEREKEGEGERRRRDVVEERKIKDEEREEIEQDREVKAKGKVEAEVELGEGRETEATEDDVEKREEDVEEKREKRGGQAAKERSIQVLDRHIVVGSVQWKEDVAKAAGALKHQATMEERNLTPSFDSARSVESFHIPVTEEMMQLSAEALSRTGIPQRTDTQETVRKMAAMKIEHRARWNTLKLLLDRGADPNASSVPMPVLFLAIKAADTDAVKKLLLSGASTDIPLSPKRKGLYPLHIAAGLPGPAGPRITEMLLHVLADPDAQANDQDDIYEQDKILAVTQVVRGNKKKGHLKSWDTSVKYSSPPTKAPVEGGRTALHVACQRDSDYSHAREVVALLLSHGASTHFLWSGHSALSLAIASGNDLAVEELLKGGADPNLPLSHGVGSALCVVANINYHSGGHPSIKTKMLDMLIKAGADMLMPVMVGGVLGTVVDYAHYIFNQDSRIAKTPFHALSMQERETFKARQQLLSMMGDLLRQAAVQRERERLEREQHLEGHDTSTTGSSVYTGTGATIPPVTKAHRKPLFKYCYQCGCSVSVVLMPCSRCRKVFYCSGTCKLKAWEERHKDECIRVSAREPGTQQSARLKSQRNPRPLSMAQKVSESHLNLKENYSSN